MSTKTIWAFAVMGLTLALCMNRPAAAQFASLVKHIPASANTIMLFNAEKVLNSEMALREGWRSNFERAVSEGVFHLSPDTRQCVLASQMDFDYMHPVWQVGILATTEEHDMSYIASKNKGTQDTICGTPAVLLPSDNFLVQFDVRTYATLVPASRQAVAQWIESTGEPGPQLSPYIREAIDYTERAGTEVILALDLCNALDLATVRSLVEKSELISGSGIDVEAASVVLASLQGVMLGVTFESQPFGSIKVDFGQDVGVLKNVAPQILLDSLAKHGAMIDDFAKWKVNVSEKQVLMSGNFSPEGLRKIFSLMNVPVPKEGLASPEQDAPDQTGSQASPIAATQQYFRSVTEFVQDLRDKEPQRIAQFGIWFDNYARKIDQLPMVNVDPEMLDYGSYVAQQFRNAGAAIQGIGVRSRVRQVQNVNAAGAPGYWGASYDGGYYYGGSYYRGGYGYARGNPQQAELRQQQRIRTQVKVEEKAQGTSAARAIAKDIDAATAYMRRQMTQKYNVEF